MKQNGVIYLLVFFSALLVHGTGVAQGFNKTVYYKVLEKGTITEIDAQLIIINAAAQADKDAYAGTLLMKKAGLMAKAKDKLKFFKSGRIKLEAAISKDNTNTEYRFLRVIIQENAPKIVKYKSELDEDTQLIRTQFKNLPSQLQEIVLDYSKNSKVLKKL